MPNNKSISPQEAEGILKRLFAVAELLAKGVPKIHCASETPQIWCEKHDNANALYRGDETSVDRRQEQEHAESKAEVRANSTPATRMGSISPNE